MRLAAIASLAVVILAFASVSSAPAQPQRATWTYYWSHHCLYINRGRGYYPEGCNVRWGGAVIFHDTRYGHGYYYHYHAQAWYVWVVGLQIPSHWETLAAYETERQITNTQQAHIIAAWYRQLCDYAFGQADGCLGLPRR